MSWFGNNSVQEPRPSAFEGFKRSGSVWHNGRQIAVFERTVSRCADWREIFDSEVGFPIGYSKANGRDRFQSYFPILGFRAGVVEMLIVSEFLFRRVVQGRGGSYQKNIVREGESGKLCEKRVIYQLNFTMAQRTAILFLGLATYLRGIITFLQLGAIFAPLDLAANMIMKAGQPQTNSTE